MSKWSFILTDSKGVKIAPILNAYEREYVANLNRPSTASFQLRKDNALIPYLFSRSEDYHLQVWQDSVLRMWGPILTSNYVATENSAATIGITAADAGWYLSKRYYWSSNTAGYPLSGDKATMAEGLIAFQNGRFPTRVIGSGADRSGSTGTYNPGPVKQALTAINDLAQGLDGFDWYIQPLTTTVSSTFEFAPYYGLFRAAAVVGSNKPNAVFEYGTGRRNMRGINYLIDQTTRANILLNVSELGLESSAANPSPFIAKADEANYLRYGIFEEMAELANVNDVTMRTKYVEEDLAIRKNKRQVFSMTSDIDDGTGRVPKFGTDYWLGDTVTAHGVTEGFTLFSGLVRVYSVQVKINNAGTATLTPILVQEGE